MSSISLTLGLRGRLLSGTQTTLQGALFGNGEPGFTFEPWDMTTLYQDRAGTTPVTAAGQSVGYRRDKSGNGNHQVAISDAKRGVYGWMPKTGRRNLLTYSEQFDNAAWEKSVTGTGVAPVVTANAAVAPDGTTTADLVVLNRGAGNASTDISVIAQTVSPALPAGTYAGSFYVKGATGADVGKQIAFRHVGASAYQVITLTAAWQRIERVENYAVSAFEVVNRGSFTADNTVSIHLWGAQLETGSTATAYQRVVSQYDITEAGVPTCYYVQADGVDDAYVTPTITPNTDKVQVFAGVRKLSDAAVAMLIEMSADHSSMAGSFNLVAPLIGATSNYGFSSRGSALQSFASASGYAAPITNVITGLGDISGDSTRLRINGTQVAQVTTDQGTGNYLAYQAYIYGRGGTELPFNGLDFGHAVRFGPNLDAATIARVESLIARNTPEVTL